MHSFQTPSAWPALSRLQAGAGLVADSVPESEYEETVNKSAALGRAIDLAEQAFVAADADGA
jgi:anthranilate synthase component 1